eukprot:GILK01008147.1.p1 GENE.GILK01008147.1~~GILK01008147.1.p1  ORF type:complete len:619 (-),score=102.31 GILK01008147.1:44-1900(-)
MDNLVARWDRLEDYFGSFQCVSEDATAAMAVVDDNFAQLQSSLRQTLDALRRERESLVLEKRRKEILQTLTQLFSEVAAIRRAMTELASDDVLAVSKLCFQLDKITQRVINDPQLMNENLLTEVMSLCLELSTRCIDGWERWNNEAHVLPLLMSGESIVYASYLSISDDIRVVSRAPVDGVALKLPQLWVAAAEALDYALRSMRSACPSICSRVVPSGRESNTHRLFRSHIRTCMPLVGRGLGDSVHHTVQSLSRKKYMSVSEALSALFEQSVAAEDSFVSIPSWLRRLWCYTALLFNSEEVSHKPKEKEGSKKKQFSTISEFLFQRSSNVPERGPFMELSPAVMLECSTAIQSVLNRHLSRVISLLQKSKSSKTKANPLTEPITSISILFGFMGDPTGPLYLLWKRFFVAKEEDHIDSDLNRLLTQVFSLCESQEIVQTVLATAVTVFSSASEEVQSSFLWEHIFASQDPLVCVRSLLFFVASMAFTVACLPPQVESRRSELIRFTKTSVQLIDRCSSTVKRHIVKETEKWRRHLSMREEMASRNILEVWSADICRLYLPELARRLSEMEVDQTSPVADTTDGRANKVFTLSSRGGSRGNLASLKGSTSSSSDTNFI